MDVGLHGIAERPHYGVMEQARQKAISSIPIVTYKNGIYKNLPEFQKTSHYHNDWIGNWHAHRYSRYIGFVVSLLELVSNI